MNLSLYIMSSCLKRYFVLLNLILQMHAGQRSMNGLIVVDAESFRSTCLGRDAYIHDHCLGYRHNYALFYQLLNNNLFTHRMLSFNREASSENYAPRVYFPSCKFPIYNFIFLFTSFAIFYFPFHKPKIPNTLLYYLYQISLSQVAVKGLTTPLLRWLRVLSLLVQVRETFYEPPTGLIPWFSKTEGNVYATIAASPFPLQGKPTQAQDVAHTSSNLS